MENIGGELASYFYLVLVIALIYLFSYFEENH